MAETPHPHRIIFSFNEGGHPTGIEILVGALLSFIGLVMIYVWVATLVWPWATGALFLLFGGILLFHSEPLLRSRSAPTSRGSPP
jgi:membrane protein implicated in regulation of membrane protease activity